MNAVAHVTMYHCMNCGTTDACIWATNKLVLVAMSNCLWWKLPVATMSALLTGICVHCRARQLLNNRFGSFLHTPVNWGMGFQYSYHMDECSGYLVKEWQQSSWITVLFSCWTEQFSLWRSLSAAFSSSVLQSLWWCTGWFIDLMESFTWVILHSTKMLEQISSYEMKVQLCVRFVFLKIYILLII
jgi:hypothetical protein